MKPVNTLLDAVRATVRAIMLHIAHFLTRVSGGRLHPNVITLVSLLAHIPIALLIAKGYFGYAALGLVIFGLFDTLDGTLARLQKRASNQGMLLDAVTDRMKEVILYMGIIYLWGYLDHSLNLPNPFTDNVLSIITVAAAGGSLLVSFVKAKGETAIAGQLSANEVNHLFQDGLMRYEVRMFVLVVGLLLGVAGLAYAVIIIALLSWLTAFSRLINISRKLP